MLKKNRSLLRWSPSSCSLGARRSRPEANPGFPNRPKLVVVLVIDQFRYDYLMRFRPLFW